MNVEKEVIISELKAKFTKELETNLKMEAFLEFSVGRYTAKTEVASEAGKQPVWKQEIVLVYFDESNIVVKAYDSDHSEQELMGSGKLQIKSLRLPGGVIELSILSENGQSVGTVTGKYTVKNLPNNPLLIMRNFRVQLVRENKVFLKSKPFLQLQAESVQISTEAKEQVTGLSLFWGESLRLRIKDSSKIQMKMLDRQNTANYFFDYWCSAREFRLQSGSKRFNVLDSKYDQLGQLLFDFETVGLVSKEQFVKNIEKEKKAQSELTAVAVERMQLQLVKQNVDVYCKLVLGNSSFTSEVIKSAPGVSTVEVKTTLYAQAKDNKMFVVVFQKGIINDEIIGVGQLGLNELSSNADKKAVGMNELEGVAGVSAVSLTLSAKQTGCKSLILDNISLSFQEQGEIIGTPEPYVVAKVGSSCGRTENGSESKMTFKKSIELKFGEQQNLILQIWDQDVDKSHLLYVEPIPLSNFKSAKGEYTVALAKSKQTEGPETKGKISLRYEMKGPVSSQSPRKLSQKKAETNRSHREMTTKEVASKKEINTNREKNVSDLESSRGGKKETTHHEGQTQRTQIEKGQTIEGSRSRETLNLPSIMSSFHQVYGDRIFDRQSAATLQKTILAYSMPKANRFVNQPKYSGQPSYCLDTCFKSSATKGAGFGFGSKRQYPEWMQRNMKQNPAPGAYFDSRYDLRSRGPTFGLGHKYYQRVMIPREQKHLPSMTRKLSPIRDPSAK